METDAGEKRWWYVNFDIDLQSLVDKAIASVKDEDGELKYADRKDFATKAVKKQLRADGILEQVA